MAKHSLFVDNAEWKLLSIADRTEVINGQETVIFTLTLKRNAGFTIFYMSIPIILLTFLCAFTFSVPVASGEKSGYAITVFLSLLVYVIVTFQKMPENSDNLSLFSLYVLGATCLSSLSVIISILAIRFQDLSPRYKSVVGCTRAFSRCIVRVQNRLLCVPAQTDAEMEAGNKTPTTMFPDDTDSNDGDEEIDKDAWLDFVSALDFVCFWVYMIVTLGAAIGLMVYLGMA